MCTRTKSFFSLLGICLAGAWTAACGSGLDSISSPSQSPASLGAAIQGTVNAGSGGGGSAQGFGFSSPAVRVSVVGSNHSTTTDSRGRFNLSGIQAGNVTLRFQAAGVDARLSLGGLVDGQVLTINVQVSGSSAQLASSSEPDEREFTGRVESVTPPTLVVSGINVLTNERTEIKRGDVEITLADIQVGETVKVEGTPQADGSVLAREIKIDKDNDDEGQAGEVEFEGLIGSVTPPSLVVAGHNVLTDSNTEFKGKGHIESVSDLNVGDLVEVEGLESTPGTVLALEIKRVEEAGDDEEEDDDDDEEDEDEDEDGEDEDEEEEEDDDDSGSGS